ncbi:MAG: HAD family hydrolase [Planctomycetes bacterium]|nr:HAD family hydrolase [Planctomycetota bacterium]
MTFDLDGTLYPEGPARRGRARRLLAPLWRLRPREVVEEMRVLRAFGAARAEVRSRGEVGDVPALQWSLVGARLGLDPSRDRVARWHRIVYDGYLEAMDGLRPYEDVSTTLAELHRRGFALGVVSDYPCEGKLRALGLSALPWALVLGAEEVGALKPHPRVFRVAAERLGLHPGAVLHVGDRPELDGAGARAAGMGSALLGAPGVSPASHPDHLVLGRLGDLLGLVALERPAGEGRQVQGARGGP